MQIAMRTVSDIGAVDRMFNPSEDTGFREYLRERWDRSMDYLSNSGSRVAKGFMERAKKIFDYANSEETLRETRRALRSSTSVRRSDSIYRCRDLEDLSQAGYGMQRYLMANPIVRAKHNKQQTDSYNETYVDNHRGKIGHDHYDWRRVNDGVWRPEQVEGEECMVREVFYETLYKNDRELDAEEQHMILDSWDIQNMFLQAGVDPTNRKGGTL